MMKSGMKRSTAWQICRAFADLSLAMDCAEPSLSGVRVRPIKESDMGFLRALYASTRAEEMAATDWTDATRERFLAQQFEFQHRYYREHHAEADFLLLLREDEPIGRLYWRAGDAQAMLIDVSLVPQERGRGIGTALLAALTARADRFGLPISLHVEPFNPALRLYRRFGFDVVGDNGVYAKMSRPAHMQAQTPMRPPEKVAS